MGDNMVRIGSRGSELALWQARWVQQRLEQATPGLVTRLEIIKTTGDRILDVPLAGIGDKGLFTREIESALLEGRIDLAVHSLKDLPTQLPDGLVLGAVTEREDPSDVFLPHPSNPCRSLAGQAPGITIGTGSLRRTSQLRALRPDVHIHELRGNLATRLRKLDESSWAGIILARAGVVRLGLGGRIGEVIDPAVILPAVGQGALGVEVRDDDLRMRALLEPLTHRATLVATGAERSLLRTLEGGCQIPIGTYGRIADRAGSPTLILDAMVGSLDGRQIIRDRIEGVPDHYEQLGVTLAQQLVSHGADRILHDIRGMTGDARSTGI